MLTKSFSWLLSTAVAVGCFIDTRPAEACGGCFHAETDTSTSFVTDHRMAISISQKQTVLWDQVKYTGNPSEFAWVLPVRDGTRVELARDEWLDALDQATKPNVKGPDLSCAPTFTSGAGGSSGSSGTSSYRGGSARSGGGGCSSSTSDSASSMGPSDDFADASFGSRSQDAGFKSEGDVQVVGQNVVGPYASVIVRSSRGAAIYDWLRSNGFAVPANVAPILAGYTAEGFDFLALRLRPNVGVGAMQPVRVVMPGAVTTLPLRMVAAGIGAKVGLELFVITEGRMRPKNFAEREVDLSALAWNIAERRSNYRELVERELAQNGNRTWVTEFSGPLFDPASSLMQSNISVTLDRFYESACVGIGPVTVACDLPNDDEHVLPPPPLDGGAPLDAGVADANADASDDSAVDASDGSASEADGGVVVAPPCTETKDACDFFDDDTTALVGLHARDVWVTRLRAELDAQSCAAGDLDLEAHPRQAQVAARLQTNAFTDPKADPCASTRGSAATPNGSANNNTYYGGDDSSGGCACSTTGDALPISPLLGAAGVLLVLRGSSRRRRVRGPN